MFTRECSIVHIGKSYTSAYIYMRACAFLLQSSTPGWSARLTAGNGFVTLSSLSFAPTRGIKFDARMGCFEKAAGLAPARENPTPHSNKKFTSRSFILGCRSLSLILTCWSLFYQKYSPKQQFDAANYRASQPVMRKDPSRFNKYRRNSN